MTRFRFDFSLLSVLLDHWRPETHTFHFTVSEIAPTLQDTSLLMGLPCVGEPMGAVDISDQWHIEFLPQFANVPQNDCAPAPCQEFTNAHEPTLTWL
jgi:hypothetical protein